LIILRKFARGEEDMTRSLLKADTLEIHLLSIEMETCKAFARVCGWVIVIELLEAPNLQRRTTVRWILICKSCK
jgi:hypothetical protein